MRLRSCFAWDQERCPFGEEHQHNFTASVSACRAPQNCHHCRPERLEQSESKATCRETVHGSRPNQTRSPAGFRSQWHRNCDACLGTIFSNIIGYLFSTPDFRVISVYSQHQDAPRPERSLSPIAVLFLWCAKLRRVFYCADFFCRRQTFADVTLRIYSPVASQVRLLCFFPLELAPPVSVVGPAQWPHSVAFRCPVPAGVRRLPVLLVPRRRLSGPGITIARGHPRQQNNTK